MYRVILFSLFSFSVVLLKAQYAPAVGQSGCTAIYKDSSIINNWATACIIERGWINIADTSLGKATNGDYNKALGKSDNSTVSLGDGGSALLSFSHPIFNGPGWDFAVFENSFDDFFLELAFVEVSSDGQNFFRFPSHSLTQTNTQIGGFGQLEATKLHNFAGKYKVSYGTPFDLSELDSINGLDINNITNIRIIDVVGSIDTAFGSTDTAGNMVNDPYPTPFASSGFDLDAVGVIHQIVGIEDATKSRFQLKILPNPSSDFINIKASKAGELIIYSQMGSMIIDKVVKKGINKIDISHLKKGIYIISIENKKGRFIKL